MISIRRKWITGSHFDIKMFFLVIIYLLWLRLKTSAKWKKHYDYGLKVTCNKESIEGDIYVSSGCRDMRQVSILCLRLEVVSNYISLSGQFILNTMFWARVPNDFVIGTLDCNVCVFSQVILLPLPSMGIFG